MIGTLYKYMLYLTCHAYGGSKANCIALNVKQLRSARDILCLGIACPCHVHKKTLESEIKGKENCVGITVFTGVSAIQNCAKRFHVGRAKHVYSNAKINYS